MPDPTLPNETLPILSVLLIIIVLLLISTNVVIFLVYRKLAKRFSSKLDTFADTVNEGVNAGAKMLEIQDFYDTASAEYQRLLNEAHRAGDREKQDRYRKLIERLNALKARTLDRTARMLDDGEKADDPSKARRRRPRRSRRSRSSRRRPDGGGGANSDKPKSGGAKGGGGNAKSGGASSGGANSGGGDA